MSNIDKTGKLKQEFTEAYDAYADALFRYCYFKTSDRDVAKDLVQQIFLKTWSYVQTAQIDSYRPFLYRVATRAVIDWYRRNKTDSLDVLSESGFDPADTKVNVSQEAEISWVFTVMDKLKADEQDLIVWRYVEDLSPREIAAILGESENVVSVRLHRAKTKLKNLLNQKQILDD